VLLKEFLSEKWKKDGEMDKSERGKYKGKSLDELKSMLAKVKESGPHKEGTPAYEKQNELEFAIRAKSGWGKVKEDEEVDIDSFISEWYSLGGSSNDLNIVDVNMLAEKVKHAKDMTAKERSTLVKKAKKGEDIGKKGKAFSEVEKKAKTSGARDPEAVAAAAMWKAVK
jgi:hypothetical protein